MSVTELARPSVIDVCAAAAPAAPPQFSVSKSPLSGIGRADIQTGRGEVVEAGRANMSGLSVRGVGYDVPPFDYIIIKRALDGREPVDWDGGKYAATCVNLKTDGYGATPSEAWRDMIDNVRDYVLLLLEHYGYSPAALERAFGQDSLAMRLSARLAEA